MESELRGWSLTEGMYNTMETRNPAVSAVITALEAIRPDVESPFIVLQAPEVDDSYPNYCQAFADERGYICEIRFFSGTDFTHYRGESSPIQLALMNYELSSEAGGTFIATGEIETSCEWINQLISDYLPPDKKRFKVPGAMKVLL